MKRFALVFALARARRLRPDAAAAPADPAAGFAGPRLEADRFVSFDGARLGLTHWDVPDGGEPWAVIVGVHGMDDYANAFHLAAPYWASQGVTTYAYDQRGFGRSPRARSLGRRRADDRGPAHHRRPGPRAVSRTRSIAVAGESLGGAVAIEAFASDRPPAADRLVLLRPAVWGWSSQPLAYQLALQAAAHWRRPRCSRRRAS